MSRVAIFTDSASDLDPDDAAAEGIRSSRSSSTSAPRPSGPGSSCPPRRSGSGWSPRTRRSRRPRRRRPASSRRPTRRPSRPAPRRSSRSTSRARCRARSRAPRSPATCCPTARSTSSTRGGASMAEGILARMGVELAAEAGPRPRSPRRSSRAPGHADVRRARHARVPQEGRADQRARRPPSGRCSRSSRSSRSSTAWWRPPTACGRGPKARERVIELICAAGRSSGSRSCTRSTPDVEAFRDEVLAQAPGLDPASVDDRPGRPVGRAAPRAGCVGAAVLYTSVVTRAATPTLGLRQGCDNLADRYHRGGDQGPPGLYSGAHESRTVGSNGSVAGPASMRPVGSSGRRPTPTRRRRGAARH